MPVYKERFHLLAERAGLDAKDCVNLFFDGLQPTLKSAINIRGHGNSLEETCKELERIEARLPVVETASNRALKDCVALASTKPYDLRPRNKPSSTYLLLSFDVFSFNLVDNSTLCTALIDTGAISNYMSYDLAIRLGFSLEGGVGVILANGTNVKSFTTKEKVKISKDEYEFFTRFRVIKGLNFPIILGMDWWCRNQPVVNLAEKQVAVVLGGRSPFCL